MKRFGTWLWAALLGAASAVACDAPPDRSGDAGPGDGGLAPNAGAALDAGPPIATADPLEAFPGGDATNTTLLGRNAFSFPAPAVRGERRGFFSTGDALFSQPWVAAPASTTARDGVGPLLNATSCDACHGLDGRGRPPESPDETLTGLLIRLAIPGQSATGGPLPDPHYGGQLQSRANLGIPVEAHVRVTYTEVPGQFADGSSYSLRHPSYAVTDLSYGPLHDEVQLSPRVAPIVVGLGLLESIPEAVIRALADPDDVDGDGISGRAVDVWDIRRGERRLGRFGWKAEQPSVLQQSAAAFSDDMGITSSLFPDARCTSVQVECSTAPSGADADGLEISDRLMDRVAFYVSVLAPPARPDWNEWEVLRGQYLFGEAGCASCHVPRHVTGQNPDFPELSGQVIWPYTDLLLHDMGEELRDAHDGPDAAEWRTPPLWGIGRVDDVNGHTYFLHDGRARNLEEAVLYHGGEGAAARDAFRAMPAADRAALLRFLESL